MKKERRWATCGVMHTWIINKLNKSIKQTIMSNTYTLNFDAVLPKLKAQARIAKDEMLDIFFQYDTNKKRIVIKEAILEKYDNQWEERCQLRTKQECIGKLTLPERMDGETPEFFKREIRGLRLDGESLNDIPSTQGYIDEMVVRYKEEGLDDEEHAKAKPITDEAILMSPFLTLLTEAMNEGNTNGPIRMVEWDVYVPARCIERTKS